jgi:hypothetical protein
MRAKQVSGAQVSSQFSKCPMDPSDGSNECTLEEPDGNRGGSGDPEPFELLDLIEEFNLEFKYEVGFRVRYRHRSLPSMAEAQETALPDTI